MLEYLEKNSPEIRSPVTVTRNATVEHVFLKLVATRTHRVSPNISKNFTRTISGLGCGRK